MSHTHYLSVFRRGGYLQFPGQGVFLQGQGVADAEALFGQIERYASFCAEAAESR